MTTYRCETLEQFNEIMDLSRGQSDVIEMSSELFDSVRLQNCEPSEGGESKFRNEVINNLSPEGLIKHLRLELESTINDLKFYEMKKIALEQSIKKLNAF